MAKLPQNIFNYLLKNIDDLNPIISVESLSGGDISSAFKISSQNHTIFLKLNSLKRAKMFRAEAKALTILRKKSQFKIPTLIAQDCLDNYSFLILEFVEMQSSYKNPEEFARLLAGLHKNTNNSFGLDHDNFIGNLVQHNNPKQDWIEFYVTQRLEIHFKMAFNNGYFSSSDQRSFSEFCENLESFIPKEKPALIHGDLWSGNYKLATNANPVLFDPALYYGHREMDLAMMKLFGGFNPKVFFEYDQNFPLEIEWQERIPIHQLYPILVHANLFGYSYAEQAKTIWKSFV